MNVVKVTEWVDIRAPCNEVFNLIVDNERRMQLSPLWGISRITNPSQDYPAEGSSYQVEITEKAETTFKTIITAFAPPKKLAYKTILENNASITWNLMDLRHGTRVIYTEEFLSEENNSRDLHGAVQKIVRDWLQNMRRYAELREAWTKRLARALLDRFYLKQLPPQRRVIKTILAMQIIGMVTFVMAAITLGFASLFT